MLEILVITALSRTNKNNAIERGRKPGGFIALTYLLWFGLEVVGFIIGAYADLGFGMYILALALAGIGGFISYQIAKNCKPGDEVPQTEKIAADILNRNETLDISATVTVTRDKSYVGALVTFDLYLNSKYQKSLQNGESITIQTNQKHNILWFTDANGTEINRNIFDMASGGHAVIHFKATKFLPDVSTGTLPFSSETKTAL
jgi:uncharacterized protein YcfJ